MGCGSALNKDLDDARKALNDGNWSSAITAATAATVVDSSNLEAYLLLCSGYAGQAGINLLEITKQLTDASLSSDAFDLVHDTLFTSMTSTGCVIGTCLSDLNTAITTLTTSFTGSVASYDSYLQEQYYFQLGLLQYIQALGLSTLTAQPSADGTITQGNITAANTVTTQADFIAAYANITNSSTGIPTSNALATTLAQNYWVLKNASVGTGTATGISQGVLQDLALCQLSPTPATAATTTVATCATFSFTTACDVTAPTATGGACTDD
jgi:hypothetical protein